MKKIKLNKKVLVSVLTGSIVLLTGCVARSDCSLAEYHLHKYEKDDLVRYMDDERLKIDGYIWTKDLVYANLDDKKLYKFEKKKDLLKIDDNIEYVSNIQNSLSGEFVEYRYEYTYLLPIVHHIRTGKTTITYVTYIPVKHHSWTTDSEHSGLTGEERVCRFVYIGYKIEKDEYGNYILIPSVNVDDLLTIKDEYPYIKEEFYKTIDVSTLEYADYEDRAFDKEEHIVPPEEEENYIVGEEIEEAKVYTKK